MTNKLEPLSRAPVYITQLNIGMQLYKYVRFAGCIIQTVQFLHTDVHMAIQTVIQTVQFLHTTVQTVKRFKGFKFRCFNIVQSVRLYVKTVRSV